MTASALTLTRCGYLCLFRLLGPAQARLEVPGRALSSRLPAWGLRGAGSFMACALLAYCAPRRSPRADSGPGHQALRAEARRSRGINSRQTDPVSRHDGTVAGLTAARTRLRWLSRPAPIAVVARPQRLSPARLRLSCSPRTRPSTHRLGQGERTWLTSRPSDPGHGVRTSRGSARTPRARRSGSSRMNSSLSIRRMRHTPSTCPTPAGRASDATDAWARPRLGTGRSRRRCCACSGTTGSSTTTC
jgi:hypothetical protein